MVKPKEFVPLQDTFKQINHLFADFSITINIFFFFAKLGKLKKILNHLHSIML
jgi:hypothetical protein